MIPVLVPRRAGDRRRDDLWAFCASWWAERPEFEIIEGHHDDGPFNRSAAINRAAGLAGGWPVSVIADADVVLDLDQVEQAVEQSSRTGRLTLAFTDYRSLNQQTTDRVLEGFAGSWSTGTKLHMTTHVSSCVVVPRPLWDSVGGFDERFEGWGWEDQAFASACRVLGGGIDRVPGVVWHLWHPPSREATLLRRKNEQPPGLRAGEALACQRYYRALHPQQMRDLLNERTTDGALLMVITDGRRYCIERAIGSTDRLVGMPITRQVICDDSGDIEYQAWLRYRFPDFEVECGRKRIGFAGNVARAWDIALGSGQRFTFWLEDDFELQRDIDLNAMSDVLDAHPHLLQMALRRQAWFPNEKAVGGVVECNPTAYTDRHDRGVDWLEHREFYTTNPALIPRSTFASRPWPNQAHSEAKFTRAAFTDPDAACGYWGLRTDDPWVIHEGTRQGTGY